MRQQKNCGYGTHMIIRLLIVISLMLICTSGNGLCEMYTWKNDDGSIGCTDTYEKVPAHYRDQVEIKKYRSNESVVSNTRDAQHHYDTKPAYREPVAKYSQEEKQELSEEEIKKTDGEIRGVWDGLKKSLKQGNIK